MSDLSKCEVGKGNESNRVGIVLNFILKDD
jgi:hypothetical protein